MWRVVLVLASGFQMMYEELQYDDLESARGQRNNIAKALAAKQIVSIGEDLILPDVNVVAVRVEAVMDTQPTAGKPRLVGVPYH